MLVCDGPASLNYRVALSQFNPSFREQLRSHAYADIYLIGTDGSIYYSVTKGADYAANVKDSGSPLTGSGLGQVFAAAIAETAPIQTPTGEAKRAAMVAAVICPTSPHSEKRIAAKEIIAVLPDE